MGPVGFEGLWVWAHADLISKLAERRIADPEKADQGGFQRDLDDAVGELLGLTSDESTRIERFIEFATAKTPRWSS